MFSGPRSGCERQLTWKVLPGSHFINLTAATTIPSLYRWDFFVFYMMPNTFCDFSLKQKNTKTHSCVIHNLGHVFMILTKEPPY